jgi:hypothetical protein
VPAPQPPPLTFAGFSVQARYWASMRAASPSKARCQPWYWLKPPMLGLRVQARYWASTRAALPSKSRCQPWYWLKPPLGASCRSRAATRSPSSLCAVTQGQRPRDYQDAMQHLQRPHVYVNRLLSAQLHSDLCILGSSFVSPMDNSA